MDAPKVSIVMPVYNAEKFLDNAILSIVSQDYQDIQLIIINDGSTDNSLSICRAWEKKDYRIAVYSQKNGGPSQARNLGLEKVSGEFLLCVDADDTLQPHAISTLVRKMIQTGADACFFAWNVIEEDGKCSAYTFSDGEISSSSEKRYSGILFDAFRCGGGYPWNKMWRVKSIIKDNEITKFDPQLVNYEDKLWVLQNLDRVRSVCYENTCLYNYYKRKTSLSNGADIDLFKRLMIGAKTILTYVKSEHSSAVRDAVALYQNHIVLFFWKRKVLFKKFNEEDIRIASEFDIKGTKITSFRTAIKIFYVWFALMIKKRES